MAIAPTNGYELGWTESVQAWYYGALNAGMEYDDTLYTFYASTDDFPQEVKDWFATHIQY